MKMISRAAIVVMGIASVAESQPTRGTEAMFARLISAAVAQTMRPVRYDGSYRRLPYPGGDVPADVGVCTDLIIRAYRAVGIDLQVRVHEDMTSAFASYPRSWRLSRPDPNIDHRRVPNLQNYFRRRGAQLPVRGEATDYRPGDLVTWRLPGNIPITGHYRYRGE